MSRQNFVRHSLPLSKPEPAGSRGITPPLPPFLLIYLMKPTFAVIVIGKVGFTSDEI